MSYKNVHKRVKRLKVLGLIEQLEGQFPRNAKPCRLTSCGLLEYLLLGLGPTVEQSFIDTYKDDTIIQTILFAHFELETIKAFVDVALAFLKRYLRKCCIGILDLVEGHRYTRNKLEEWKASNPPSLEHTTICYLFPSMT